MGTCLHCFRHAGLLLNFFFTNMNIVWRALWCHMWQFDRTINNSYPGPTSWKKNGGPFASYETHFVVFSTCSLGQWLGVKLFQKTMHLQECTTSLINTLLQVLNILSCISSYDLLTFPNENKMILLNRIFLLCMLFILVSSVKFANDDRSRVACSSLDGTLSICQVIPPPATVICMLKGHKKGVKGQWCSLITKTCSNFVDVLQTCSSLFSL